MSKIRCLVCGGSRLDLEGYKCDRCGAAIGLRDERCYVNEETKKKLLEHADDLSNLGIKMQQREILQEDTATKVAFAALIIACADSFHHGVLNELVVYLRDELLLPEDEILRLRLDEPEQILTYYRMDKSKTAQCEDPHSNKTA